MLYKSDESFEMVILLNSSETHRILNVLEAFQDNNPGDSIRLVDQTGFCWICIGFQRTLPESVSYEFGFRRYNEIKIHQCYSNYQTIVSMQPIHIDILTFFSCIFFSLITK